jgi:hypothetical protein
MVETVGEYGIFGLTLSTTHLDANQHFISGFATMQGKAIPNANLINTSLPYPLLFQKIHLFYDC